MPPSINAKIKQARIKLFRRDIGLSFFGAMGYKFDWSIEDMPDSMEGFVLFDKKNLCKSEDGIIHVNKNFVGKDDYTHDNLIALIIHEQLHILRKDGVRRGSRTHKLWCIAADHCTDRDLKEICEKTKSGVVPYQNRYNVINDLHAQQPKCTVEQAYDWINKNDNRFTITMNPENSSGNSPGGMTVKDDKTGEEWQVNLQTGGQDQSKTLSPDDKIKIQQITNNFISQARARYETMKSKGAIASGATDYLDNLLKVEIPWETLLEKAIKTNTVMKPDDRSWRKLNKFFQPHGITLPGYCWTEDEEGVGILIITADSSGSISKTNLKQFSSVIYQSMRYFEKIMLIVHDVNIHQEKTFTKDNIAQFYSFIKTEGFKGRGGTSHAPAFNKIEELWNDNAFKNDLSMVISLTDGYSDLESIVKKYKWLKSDVPLVLTITGSWNHDFADMDNISLIHIN